MFKKFIILLALLGQASLAESQEADRDDMVSFLREYLQVKYKEVNFDTFIYVAAKSQKLYVVEGGKILKTYLISASKKGIGYASGSFQTPDGLHLIAEKVGAGFPINTVIKHKVPTGTEWAPIQEALATNKDIITSRILHLRGLEPNKNSGTGVDSYSRGIFIHGTHEEGLLGTPASKGCIRMSNAEVIDLFDRVEVDTFVIILNN